MQAPLHSHIEGLVASIQVCNKEWDSPIQYHFLVFMFGVSDG
jgi:hypothetical protein